MAKTHAAKKIIGAEINPAIHEQMSLGGALYDYSGKIYTAENVEIFKIDGRHLIKTLTPNTFDLIVLNGVDTFSGLSTGAYAYAESYLYTKNALIDYLNILDKNGIINFNRWIFAGYPRETLKLMAISLEALRETGVKEPWKHIIIGAKRWSFVLIKKSPFTLHEKQTIKDYFKKHKIRLMYPTENWENKKGGEISFFDLYAQSFIDGQEKSFAFYYPFDISVITDDNPFFYKYYKLNSFNPFAIAAVHHTGTVIFMTQLLVLAQAIVFIALFILLPLFIFKKSDITALPPKTMGPFIIFFGCLGVGFMFIEIPIMQRFVLLLGSPIYAISVTLAALLMFCGIGSFLLTYWQKKFKPTQLLTTASFVLISLTLFFILFGTRVFDFFMGFHFAVRVGLVCLLLMPLGMCLGMYFPSGLQLIGKDHRESIAWAWGINAGFSVLGSMLAIFLAQFYGFNTILLLALVIYLVAILAFRRLAQFVV